MPLSIHPIAPAPRNPATPATAAHFQATLEGLQPGIYLSRDMYQRYVSICREADVWPVHANHFGRQMTAAGYHSRRNAAGTARCWVIYPPD